MLEATMLFRRLHLVLILAATTACYSWRAEPRSPDPTTPKFGNHVVRLTLADGRRITVRDPRTANDTVRAWEAYKDNAALVVVPTSEIRVIESEHPGVLTALGVLLTIGIATSILLTNVISFEFR